MHAFLNFFQPQSTCLCCREAFFDPLEAGLCELCAAKIKSAPREDLHTGLQHGADDIDCALCLCMYGDGARQQVLALKFSGMRSLGTYMGREMAALAPLMPFEPDAVIPVPLHWTRRLRRGYNQSDVIARGLGEITGWHVDPSIIKRRKHTTRNASLSHESRAENVRGAFELKGDVRGRSFVLIDDVLTTGSTVAQCARILREGGAAHVAVMAYARAGKNRDESENPGAEIIM